MSTKNRESYADTVRRLSSAQKAAAPGAPAYSILVNRRLGRYIAAAAYRRGLTPNGVTGLSALLTFSGILLLAIAPPTLLNGVIVWILLAVGYAFDSADGQVARLRGGGSLSGEWLDHVVDSVKIVALHCAVAVSLFRWFSLPSDALLLVPIGFAIVATGMFFAMILNDLLKAVRAARSGSAVPARPRGGRLRSILVLPTDYGILCLIFLTLGFPALFVVLYTGMFAVNTAYFGLAARKWFRDMAALDSAFRLS